MNEVIEKELKMYASKWLAEKMNPLGVEKTEDCLDIDESVTLYYCPKEEKMAKEILDLFGYEIGIAEAGEDWTVFVVMPEDINGRTYESWSSEELCMSKYTPFKELENNTLSCSNCGSLLIGEQPAIELPYCAECPDKDKIQELLMIITDELWDFIPEDHRKIVDSNLKQLGL